MSVYLEKVEATFDQIYFEQYLEELEAAAASASAAGKKTKENEYLPTFARPPTTALPFDRTVTSPSRATTTSFYQPTNVTAACGAWVSLIRYCGTTETNAKSLSECYCTSGTDYVPDQWNSLAARCAKAKFKYRPTGDWLCDLTEHASSSTDFCKAGGDAVSFHTNAKHTVAPYMTAGLTGDDDDDDEEPENSMGCNEFNTEDHCVDQQSSDDADSGGSSDDYAAEPAVAQPKATSSAAQAPLTTTSESTRSTVTTHASRTSSSSISSTLPSATSASSAQSLIGTLDFFVSRVVNLWLLAICALWLL